MPLGAHLLNGAGRRANENDARFGALVGKDGILREEPVARVDSLHVRIHEYGIQKAAILAGKEDRTTGEGRGSRSPRSTTTTDSTNTRKAWGITTTFLHPYLGASLLRHLENFVHAKVTLS